MIQVPSACIKETVHRFIGGPGCPSGAFRVRAVRVRVPAFVERRSEPGLTGPGLGRRRAAEREVSVAGSSSASGCGFDEGWGWGWGWDWSSDCGDDEGESDGFDLDGSGPSPRRRIVPTPASDASGERRDQTT